jgi:hypothetical protein
MSDHLDLHSKHFIDVLRVFISLGDLPLDGLGCSGVTKVMVDLEKFVLPSLCRDLIVKTKLDLGDRSKWIRVEKDSTLCELLDRDVGNLCGWPNIGNKSYVSSACLFQFTLCSCPSLFLLRICPNLRCDS